MSPFLSRVAAFVAIQLVVLAVFGSLVRVRPRGDYVLVWGDKDRRLERVPPPRILLVGGSNLAFGVDSKALSARLGRPVLNLGVHAGLGRELMLRQAERVAGQGDLVVLALEYTHLFREVRHPILAELFVGEPRALRDASWGHASTVLDHGLAQVAKLPRLAWRVVTRPKEEDAGMYTRTAFDETGDNVHPRKLPARRPLEDRESFAGFDDESLGAGVLRLNAFAAKCRAQGATVAFTFPPMTLEDASLHRETLARLDAALRASLQVPIVDRPEDLALPDRLFFDTAYHLTRAGTRRRTEHLAARLAPYVRGEGLVTTGSPSAASKASGSGSAGQTAQAPSAASSPIE